MKIAHDVNHSASAIFSHKEVLHLSVQYLYYSHLFVSPEMKGVKLLHINIAVNSVCVLCPSQVNA